MSRRSAIFYSESQCAQMWERWRAGDPLEQIADMFDRRHSSIREIFEKTAGIDRRSAIEDPAGQSRAEVRNLR